MLQTGTRKKVDRRREIHLIAARMFVEKGFEGTSLTDISAEINVSKAALYYYFESKQELFYEIVNLGLESVKNEVLVPGRKIEDAEERLRFIILNHARLAAEGNHPVIIISHEMNSLTFKQHDYILNLRRTYFNFLQDTLIALRIAGKVREIDIKTATLTLFGIMFALSRSVQADNQLSVEKICQSVCEMTLNGLLQKPPHGEMSAASGN